jgi:peptidyl-prolyl cis-trans isomerase C
MKHIPLTAVITFIVLLISPLSGAEEIFSHGGVGMTRVELAREIARWSPDMQQAAANDTADRLELLNKSLVAKKIANEALQLREQDNPDLYWKIQFKVREEMENIMIREHLANLEVPDMRALAQERYLVEKDRWALVPEQRLSSHILILCENNSCYREAAKAKAETVSQRLAAGEDFAALAAELSEDTASKSKGGQFKRWLKANEKGVSKEYVGAVFELSSVGDISPVTGSQFGYHIIKLDDTRPAHYLSYDEVEGKIISALETEYRTESARAYVRSFNLDDSARINGPAMEELFSQYKTTANQSN